MRFDLVQVLRALAALAVVLYHSAGATLKYSPFPAPSYQLWGSYGNFGVDLFFVISGFVIFHTTRDMSAAQFASKRIKRIVPIYWLLTLLAFALAATIGLSGRGADFGHLASSLGFVSFTQWNMPLLYVGWSLEYEMYFYAVVTIALLATRNPWPAAVSFLCGMVAVGHLFSDKALSFLAHPIMLEFVAGILIAQAFHRRIGRIELTAFALAVAAAVLFRPAFDVLPLVVASGLVVAAVFLNRPAPRWLTRLGDASYSIYLVQVFTVPVVAKVMRAAWPAHHPELLVVAAAAATLAAGMLSFVLLEKPIGRMLQGRRINGTPQHAMAASPD